MGLSACLPSVQVFISHNHEDQECASRLGAQLRLTGADIWFSEWEINAGDSIPGRVSEAIEVVDAVVILWSEHARASSWVRAERDAALARKHSDDDLRIIPVILDDTPLPGLLCSLKWVDLRDGDETRATNEIMGFANDQQRLLAIQGHLDDAGIRVEFFHGYGPLVCCPRCGAGVEMLRGWSEVDERRDDMYAGFRCTACHFSGGGEV